MPQKLPAKLVSVVDFSRSALGQRPGCAVLIATISSEWARLEHELTSMFGAATGLNSATSKDTWQSSPNLAAFAALAALESLHARIAAITAAFDAIDIDARLKTSFAQISLELRKRAKERNAIIHGLWGIVDNYPNDVILKSAPQTNDLKRYTQKDFEQAIERLTETGSRVSNFTFQVTATQAEIEIGWPEDP